MKYIIVLIIAISSLQLSGQEANEWSKWRGPNADGTIKNSGFTKAGLKNPKVIWRKKVGKCHGSITIKDGRLFTAGWTSDKTSDSLAGTTTCYCFDADSGNEIWNYTFKSDSSGWVAQRSTPTVDDNRVYFLGRFGDLFCLNTSSGEPIWHRNINADSLCRLQDWGYSTSPVIYNNTLLLNAGSAGIALDKNDGTTLWKSGIEGRNESSPSLIEIEDKTFAAFINSKLISICDIQTGELMWEWEMNESRSLDITQFSDDKIFLNSELIEIKNGSINRIWLNDSIASAFQNGVVSGDYAYQFAWVRNPRAQQLYCVDIKTGKPLWGEKFTEMGGTVSLAGNTLVILTGRGALVLADANTEKYQELSKNIIFEGMTEHRNYCFGLPAIVDGKIYLRNAFGAIACIDAGY